MMAKKSDRSQFVVSWMTWIIRNNTVSRSGFPIYTDSKLRSYSRLDSSHWASGLYGGEGGPMRGNSVVYVIYKKSSLNAKITLLKVVILYLTVQKNKIKSNKNRQHHISMPNIITTLNHMKGNRSKIRHWTLAWTCTQINRNKSWR